MLPSLYCNRKDFGLKVLKNEVIYSMLGVKVRGLHTHFIALNLCLKDASKDVQTSGLDLLKEIGNHSK